MKIIEARLAAFPAVRGLRPEYQRILVKSADERVFGAGEVVIRQSQPANELFLIEQGRVQVEWRRPGQPATPVHVAGAGEIVGWSWLFPPFVSHFEVRAIEPVKTVVVNGGSLLAACEESSDFGFELINCIARVVLARLQSARDEFVRKVGIQRAFVSAAPSSGGVVEGADLRERLTRHPFLRGLSGEDLNTLADCAMEVEFKKGEEIFRAGDLANRFYLLLDGEVILKPNNPAVAQTIEVLRGGDVLGWSWLYEPYQWHFDARATEQTRAIFMYGTRLRELCERDHRFGLELLRRVTRVVIHRLEAVCDSMSKLGRPASPNK